MTLRERALRAYRSAVRPLHRQLIRRRDARRLRALLEANFEPEARVVFVVVVPKILGWLDPCLKLVPPETPLVLVANGVSGRELRSLCASHPQRPVFRMTGWPGAYAKHGTALDVIARAAIGDFLLLDHDCYVFEASLFESFDWGDGEFLATADAPGFVTVNRSTGLRFPRTHFLVVRRDLVRRLMNAHRVGCEKVRSTPRRLAPLLAGIGLGDHNFPPVHMQFYDTLQLLMAVALAEGHQVRTLPVGEGGILHVGGTARARNQPGIIKPGTPRAD